MKKIKYHITQDGPRECRAKERLCPLGGEHFDSRDEANTSYLFGIKEEFSTVPISEKRSLPDLITVGALRPMKGGSYFGTVITDRLIGNHLALLEKHIGEEKFKELEQNKVDRDGDYHFHMTILEPKDVRKIGKGTLKDMPVFNTTLKGIGSVSNEAGNETWYIIVESDEIQNWREDLGLEPKDLHITLGFLGKDIYNMRKNEETAQIK